MKEVDALNAGEVETVLTSPQVRATRRVTGWQAWRPVLLLVLVVISWASATVASKHLYLQNLVTPFTLVVCRFTLAASFALLLFGFGQRRRGFKTLPLVGGWQAYLIGGFFITCFIVGFNLALLYITATLGGLFFFGLTPIIMLVIGHFWLGTAVGWRQAIGVIIAVAGMLIALSGGDIPHFMAALTGSNLPLGLFLMAVAALGWGAFGIWGKRYSSPLPGASLLSTGINEIIGVLPVWALFFLLEPNGFANLSLETWLYILYIGIVPSSLGFALFYSILKDLSVNQAATIQLLSPVFTALLAILFLGEPFSLALLIGTAVLLWGVRVSTAPKAKAKA